MRQSWKDYFKPGSHEREAFDDMSAIISQETKKETLQVNVGSSNVPFGLTHTLNKVPTSFVLTQSEDACIIYATESDRLLWTNSRLTLRSTTTGGKKIEIT
jgi:hypothetical protein